jgi:hypothetical protein
MAFLKRQLPVILAFIAGIVLWAQYYIPSKASQDMLKVFSTSWAIILTGAALVLGILSAIHYHYSKVKLHRPGYGYSIVTLVTFFCVSFIGLFPIKYPGFSASTIQPHGLFDWIFNNVFVALDATMFSLLAFFIASAAFRAFRARTPEATALLIAGCIVMIGRVPFGEWLGTLTHGVVDLPVISSWILNIPNAAAQRGIILGVILSQVAISLRIIFGVERTYMGGGD